MRVIRDTRAFYARANAELFAGAITQDQVNGINCLLTAIGSKSPDIDPRHLAYEMATAYHETGRAMEPVMEYGGNNPAAYFMDRYDRSGSRPAVAAALGNGNVGDGAMFCGRGHAQITGRRNYGLFGQLLGVNLLEDPDKALDPEVSALILHVGMQEGLFTGARLSRYINGSICDFVNARRTVNGLDKASLIAGYAVKWLDAVEAK